MRRLWHSFALFSLAATLGCSRAAPPAPLAGNAGLEGRGAASAERPPLPEVAVAAGDGLTVDAPRNLGELSLYVLRSKKQTDPGPVVTLEDALKSGGAEVREVAKEGVALVNDGPQHGPHQGRRLARTAGGATVGTLVIENKGDTAIFVMAGTVVKGGNQDRQISQDFVIEPRATTPVDAFCVEAGRWQGTRDGQSTGGKFGATQVVATSKVRAAAQYKQNQSEVWEKVAEANLANKKGAATGTFMATLDDKDISRRREELAAEIARQVKGATPGEEVVGLAYAIDGQIRGARAFMHHRLFAMNESKLAQSIALEAITAKAEREQQGRAIKGGPPLPASDVTGWMKEVDDAPESERRDTAASNVNEYKASSRAYGSKTRLKPKAGAPSPPAAPLSVDFLAK